MPIIRRPAGVVRPYAAAVDLKGAVSAEALARLVGWNVTLKELALRMRCSRCGKKAAEVVAVCPAGHTAVSLSGPRLLVN